MGIFPFLLLTGDISPYITILTTEDRNMKTIREHYTVLNHTDDSRGEGITLDDATHAWMDFAQDGDVFSVLHTSANLVTTDITKELIENEIADRSKDDVPMWLSDALEAA